MKNNNMSKNSSLNSASLGILSSNIEEAKRLSTENRSVKVAAVVSGNKATCLNWAGRLKETGAHIFNRDKSTLLLSLEEKIGKKEKEGNFLGTLLAYKYMKEAALKENVNYFDSVSLIGMLFGKGERISPITQASGCSKPCIKVTPANIDIEGRKTAFSAIEEAMLYFVPVAKYLERRGFKGVLSKWGDQTEIASIDLMAKPEKEDIFSKYDVVKFVSVMEVTEEAAKHKDWVVFDKDNNMTAQVSRNTRDVLIKELGVLPDALNKHYAGVSLGPVAVSYEFLEIASEVFKKEIVKDGVCIDFDPYLLMALAMSEHHTDKWEEMVLKNQGLGDFLKMMPDFFDKVQEIKRVFAEKHGRKLNLKVLDLGEDLYWADIGQHAAMREKYLTLKEDSTAGGIARRLAGIPDERDEKGNIIVGSHVSSEIDIRDSVIVGTRITGSGKVAGSVFIDSEFTDIDSINSFSIGSVRRGSVKMPEHSGLYESIGAEDLVLKKKERHVSVLVSDGKTDMKVSEDTDLRDKDNTYNVPILGNKMSFLEAYNEMFGVGMDEIERRREKVINSLKELKPLKFGTSGLRDKVEFMTDRECYINTKGFISFLEERGEMKKCTEIAVAGDRRSSTPRIMIAVIQAIKDSGYLPVFCGHLPSPALTCFAVRKEIPSIMVTGSHIPDDRNGIKFTKRAGEVLKSDEDDILRNVASCREEIMKIDSGKKMFDEKGMFAEEKVLPTENNETTVEDIYVQRYLDVIPGDALAGKKVVLYQHSAVGRDIVKKVFEGVGAEVIAVGRSETFVPVDTEKVSDETRSLLKKWAEEYKPFAIISTDGDSDRPLLADSEGEFLTGDKLGALVALFLKPDFAAVPISTNDAVISALEAQGIGVTQTKIGSPYVIKAMISELAKSPGSKVVSWESNGGFLLGSDWTINGKTLKALSTRDAILPLMAVMLQAIEKKKTISGLISSSLPERYTHADVIDDKTEGCEVYTAEMGKKIVEKFSVPDGTNKERFKTVKESLSKYFNKDTGFGEIVSINSIDGIRIVFSDNKVAHLRPSGNAPEFRMYATADTQKEAEEIVEKRLVIMPMIIADMVSGGGSSEKKVIDAISRGIPLYIKPYEEPKVWGVKGIGEYWYGAEDGEKSSEVFYGENRAKAVNVLKADPGKFLGKSVVEKFGERLPLVKILTPKGRLSVQFHDSKNELWIVTGIDRSVCGSEPRIILGFNQNKIDECGKEITGQYKKALESYAVTLNELIDMLEGSDNGKKVLKQEKDVLNAARKMADKNDIMQEKTNELLRCREEIDGFYGYRTVKIGDVIPVPSGTLHALGPGIEVVEPQIAGPTQSLEDGETYPVRYYFPGFERADAQKQLDIDRIGEMNTSGKIDFLSEVIENKGDTTIERLPGNFSDKGLEVHRITLKKGGKVENKEITSFHNMVVVSGKAKAVVGGEEYEVPGACPGGNMLIIPASAGNFTIISCDGEAQIIDTFTPLF